MSDEELLHAMGATLRDGVDLHADVWDRLAAGSLSDDALAALRADPDPEVQAALAAFAPLGAAELDQLEAIARGALDAAATPREAEVIALPRRRRWIPAAAAVVALAAGLLLFALRPVTVEGPRLPAYSLELVGGDKPVRSADQTAARPLLRPDSLLQLTLRPPTAVDAGVQARAFLVTPRTHAALSATLDVGPNGVVTFEGPAARLFGSAAAGDYDLVILLTTDAPAATPTAPGARVVRTPIRWRP